MKVYVAVIVVANNAGFRIVEGKQLRSQRPEGDWFSFIHTNKKEAMRLATAAMHKWNGTSSAGHTYRVLVGELSGEAKINFSVVKIKG